MSTLSMPPNKTLLLIGAGVIWWLNQKSQQQAKINAATAGTRTLTGGQARNALSVPSNRSYSVSPATANVGPGAQVSNFLNMILQGSGLVKAIAPQAARNVPPAGSGVNITGTTVLTGGTDYSASQPLFTGDVTAQYPDFGYSSDAVAMSPAPGTSYGTDAFQVDNFYGNGDALINGFI